MECSTAGHAHAVTGAGRRSGRFAAIDDRTAEIVLIAALLGVTAALRLPGLAGDGMWRDQANVYVGLTAPGAAEFVRRVIGTEWHPPLYFVLAAGWARLTGTNETALLLFPFGASVAAAAAVYALGKAVVSRAAGTAAALLYALSPMAIAYACEYVYALALLLFTVLAWLTVRSRMQPFTRRRALALGCATALVAFTHYVALLFVPLLAALTLASPIPARRRIAIAAVLAAGMVPFAWWLPVFIEHCRIGVPYRAVMTPARDIAFSVAALGSLTPVWPPAAAVLFWATAGGCAVALVRARRFDRDAAAGMAMVAVVLGVMIAKNQLEARYVLPLYGLWCVALASIGVRTAQLVAALDPRYRRVAAVVGIVAACAAAGADVAHAVRAAAIPKSGIRAIDFGRSATAATLYVIAPDYLASTFAYYARDAHVRAAGFVRWDQPEIFRLDGYAAAWNAPDAVGRTLRAIDAARADDRFVDVVADDRVVDEGRVPYRTQVARLLAALRARYRLVRRLHHPGRNEDVSEYRFALTPL